MFIKIVVCTINVIKKRVCIFVFEDGLDTASVDQILQYKTVILRVGYDVNKHGFANPCQYLIDDEVPLQSDFDSEEYRFEPCWEN